MSILLKASRHIVSDHEMLGHPEGLRAPLKAQLRKPLGFRTGLNPKYSVLCDCNLSQHKYGRHSILIMSWNRLMIDIPF